MKPTLSLALMLAASLSMPQRNASTSFIVDGTQWPRSPLQPPLRLDARTAVAAAAFTFPISHSSVTFSPASARSKVVRLPFVVTLPTNLRMVGAPKGLRWVGVISLELFTVCSSTVSSAWFSKRCNVRVVSVLLALMAPVSSAR